MNADTPRPDTRRSSSNLGGKVAASAGLLWALSMLLRVIGFVTMLVLARVLAPSDFGLVALATAAIGIIEVLTNVQTNLSIINSEEPDKSWFDTAFTLNLLRGLATAGILATVANPLAVFMKSPALEPILYVLIIPTFLIAFSNPYFILYARSLNFRLETQRRAAAAIASSVVSIGMAFIFRSYWALVAGLIIQSFVMLGLSYWRVPGRPGLSLRRWREMFGFGFWILVQQLFHYMGLRFDYFFLGHMFNPATVGAYHVGTQVNNMASADVVPVLSKALFPAFSMISGDGDRLKRNYVLVQSVATAISLPVGFGLGLLAEPIIRLLLGPGWDLAVPVVQILAPVLAFQSLGAGVEGVAMALNQPRLLAVRAGIYAVVRTAVVVAGYALGGFIGIIAGRAVAAVIYPAYNLVLGATLTGTRIRDPLISAWRSFVSVAAMSAVLLVMQANWAAPSDLWGLAWFVAASAFAGGLTYVGVHLALWHWAGRPIETEAIIFQQVVRLRKRLGYRP